MNSHEHLLIENNQNLEGVIQTNRQLLQAIELQNYLNASMNPALNEELRKYAADKAQTIMTQRMQMDPNYQNTNPNALPGKIL